MNQNNKSLNSADTMKKKSSFTSEVLAWYQLHGRHDLPWQHPITPYRVWLSETMLQQTQVTTVIDYFQCFIHALPDVTSLANAELDQVMHLWSGLGYYRRAKHLHQAAQQMQAAHHGKVPDKLDELMALSGIGRSTAGAILAIAFQKPFPILDGNVKRVLCRYFGVEGWPDAPKTQKILWPLAEQFTPKKNCHHYTQAIMDLGATLCTRNKPQCSICPVHANCFAMKNALTTVLPTKKPRKKIPLKSLHFWLLQKSSGELFISQRPNEGLWANLWTFPEGECPIDKKNIIESIHLTTFEHLLTHYRLTISCSLLKIHNNTEILCNEINNQHNWCIPSDITTHYGIPRFMNKILEQLSNQIIQAD